MLLITRSVVINFSCLSTKLFNKQNFKSSLRVFITNCNQCSIHASIFFWCNLHSFSWYTLFRILLMSFSVMPLASILQIIKYNFPKLYKYVNTTLPVEQSHIFATVPNYSSVCNNCVTSDVVNKSIKHVHKIR